MTTSGGKVTFYDNNNGGGSYEGDFTIIASQSQSEQNSDFSAQGGKPGPGNIENNVAASMKLEGVTEGTILVVIDDSDGAIETDDYSVYIVKETTGSGDDGYVVPTFETTYEDDQIDATYVAQSAKTQTLNDEASWLKVFPAPTGLGDFRPSYMIETVKQVLTPKLLNDIGLTDPIFINVDGLTGWKMEKIDQDNLNFDYDNAVSYSQGTIVTGSVIVDNTNGLNPKNTPTVTVSYSTTNSNTHQTSEGFTVGTKIGFSEKVGVGALFEESETTISTEISFSNTYTVSNSTSETQQQTFTEADQIPVEVPKGKKYKVEVDADEYSSQIPLTFEVKTIGGKITANYRQGLTADKYNGHRSATWNNAGEFFAQVNQYSAASEGNGASAYYQQVGNDGNYIMTGTQTVSTALNLTSHVYDITQNQTGVEVDYSGAKLQSVSRKSALNSDKQDTFTKFGKNFTIFHDREAGVGVYHQLDGITKKITGTNYTDKFIGSSIAEEFYPGGGDDRVLAGAGNDTIIDTSGKGRRNFLAGEEGDDVITAKDGVDKSVIVGGEGNDTLSAYGVGSFVIGGKGDDTIYLDALKSKGSVIADQNGNNALTIEGIATNDFKFSRVADHLYINLDDDSKYNRGQDIAWANFFNNLSNGKNTINGLSTSDVEALISGDDSTVENPKPNLFFGTAKDDVIDGDLDLKKDTLNLVFAGKGNDTVDTSTLKEGNIDGGLGNDKFFVGSHQSVDGKKGNDFFDASAGEGFNRLDGGADDDTFILGSNDRLRGRQGEDLFFVGTGGDNIITGGNDADQFWIANGDLPVLSMDEANIITDFDKEIDVIGIGGNLGITTAQISFTQKGSDVLIAAGDSYLAKVLNIKSSDLSAENNADLNAILIS